MHVCIFVCLERLSSFITQRVDVSLSPAEEKTWWKRCNLTQAGGKVCQNGRKSFKNGCFAAVFIHLCSFFFFFLVLVSSVPAFGANERQDEFFCLGRICSAHVHCSEGEREQSYGRKVPPVLQSHHTSVPLLLFHWLAGGGRPLSSGSDSQP